jgi:hypothetical protein
LTLALAALVLPSLTFANHEHRATVLMRSGDRVAGLLEDVENGIVYVRVSLHDQRKLGIGDVALIDFVGGAAGLPETELSVARRGEHLVMLRDGSNMTGQFVDIRGGEAGAAENETHELHFRTGNDVRRVPLDRVARIYLGNFPGATTESSGESQPVSPAGSVRVPANQQWVATPLTVRRGDQVRSNVTGQIQLSEDPQDTAISAGSTRQRRAAGSPLPNELAGALIGRVGNSPPFAIGNSNAAITMPADGQLYVGVNDDVLNDNYGDFFVSVNPGRRRR